MEGVGGEGNLQLDPHLPAQGSILAAAQEVPSKTPTGLLPHGDVGWWVGSAQASVCLKFQHLQNIRLGLFWGGISYRNVNIRDLEGSCRAWRWWVSWEPVFISGWGVVLGVCAWPPQWVGTESHPSLGAWSPVASMLHPGLAV